ncbi:MAG: hypothetical protein QMB24_14085 [Spirosomataceae bacterium]
MGVRFFLSRSGILKERYGVYMGIINMKIVIPMIIQTLTFGYIMREFLDNDPRNTITFGGVLLLLAALATLLIKPSRKNLSDEMVTPATGH